MLVGIDALTYTRNRRRALLAIVVWRILLFDVCFK